MVNSESVVDVFAQPLANFDPASSAIEYFLIVAVSAL